MASNITHYFFGKRVVDFLPNAARVVVQKYPRHFLLGNQGPDLFFYHLTSKKKAVGGLIHDLPLEDFLSRNREFLLSLPADSPTWAYLLGLLCHFSLDIAFHPYIDAVEGRMDIKHIAIEREFDRYVLDEEGVGDAFALIDGMVPHPDLVSHGVFPLYRNYCGIDIHDIRQALLSFRLALRFFHVENEGQRRRKLRLMDAFGMRAFSGMLMKPDGYVESNCITTPVLKELMSLAYPIAREATLALYGEPRDYPAFFSLNFNGR